MANSFTSSDAGDFDKNDTTLTVVLDEEMHTITVKSDESILDAALDAGLDAPYSCQGGVCASCMAQITEGAAIMDNNTILTDEEINDGLILTCQAHPTTNTIAIDYDAV
ncbi:MAG: 2Fe-2S iron-sulfur cluster-binding protein [Flavobacteriaceae bacterium]|nr:2Fe-2S iron-sulfur cluster-binding protein [Flavobacteriaceae bacterium]